MPLTIAYLKSDATLTWKRAARTWSDRATPCTSCGYELSANPSAPLCTECGKSINWSPSFLTDGRHNLLIPIFLALTPIAIRALSIKAELLWRSNALELAQMNLPPNFDALFLIDAVAFPLQFLLTALALVTSITWTRTLPHAIARFALVTSILAAYWAIAPSAYLWY
ncbi:MAG: hypothetical protein ACYTF7_09335 [Planctomycetota bacterium]|jgi:hypothetical protein